MVDLMSVNSKTSDFYIFYNGLKAASYKDPDLCLEEQDVIKMAETMYPGLETTFRRSMIPNPLPGFSEFATILKSVPSRLRVGDINSDGYPDLIGQ